MKRTLFIKAHADIDVANHYLHLLARNPRAAEKLRTSIRASYKRIQRNCRACASLPLQHFGDLELRFCRPRGFENHLIVFQVTDDAVFILRVLHSSQDLEAELRPA